MKNIILTLTVICLLGIPAFAQQEESPEDVCKAAGSYWSEDLEQCFAVADMDDNEILIFREINKLQAQKDARLHEQQEYSAAGKAASITDLNNRISELMVLAAAAEPEVAVTYNAEIAALEGEIDAINAFDVTDHGAIISALSVSISKHREALDASLQ